ncbi:ABA4-like family protein [Hymenobacter sp. GOD-10R]|uniref:ABA4-like family protein n=1 Tax=Hymenobacter sp. GOD-10R TaxID=3093922 RepID=UPI002D78FC6C|nr:ABA4-like family protein [Hymenobacter sp. GOD-10R]WRQ30114.1 ABA4-like family protein [Hymenobacter sp. GOD-10R]
MTFTPSTLFQYANQAALLGWLLLLVAPRWRFTQRLIVSGAWSLGLAVVYTVVILSHYLGGHASEGGFGSLTEVAALFRDPWALLAGWVHYLCFDLAVGAWASRDAQQRGVPHLLLVPALLLTFLFGPVGFLLYHVVRRWYAVPQVASAL